MRRYAGMTLVITLSAGFTTVPATTSSLPRTDRLPVLEADSLLGVFEGRTPCGPIANGFTGFPSQGCEKIKWRLTLYRNPASKAPSSYLYQGTRTTHQGSWRAAADSDRRVYQLSPSGAGEKLSLLSIEDKVLLLLNRDGGVLAGDASWSYALNRVEQKD
jgi:hypothetical protein